MIRTARVVTALITAALWATVHLDSAQARGFKVYGYNTSPQGEVEAAYFQEQLATSAIRPCLFEIAPDGLARCGGQRIFLHTGGLASAHTHDTTRPIQVL